MGLSMWIPHLFMQLVFSRIGLTYYQPNWLNLNLNLCKLNGSCQLLLVAYWLITYQENRKETMKKSHKNKIVENHKRIKFDIAQLLLIKLCPQLKNKNKQFRMCWRVCFSYLYCNIRPINSVVVFSRSI